MPSTRIFIFCGGRGERWESTETTKHMVPIPGDGPLLHRTFRQFHPHGNLIQVGGNPEWGDGLVGRYVAAREKDSDDRGDLAAEISNVLELSGHNNIGLLGDCFFSDRAVGMFAALADKGDLFHFVGRDRASPITFGPPEVFGLTWKGAGENRLREACDAAVRQAEDAEPGKKYDRNGRPYASLWQMYRHLCGIPLDAELFDETGCWRRLMDYTDDFDSEERYRVWCQRYALRMVKMGPFKPVDKARLDPGIVSV